MTRIRSSGPIVAVGLLTSLPVGVHVPEEGSTGAPGWFPLVGAGFGALGWVTASAAYDVAGGNAPWVVAALVVGVWAYVSRMLHWDGLADVADALWGGADAPRRLEIMRDSSVGAFGAFAIAFTCVLQIAAIAALGADGLAAVLIAPIIGRASAMFACWLGTPARPDGLGRSLMAPPAVSSLLAGGIIIGAVVGSVWAIGGVEGTVAAVAWVATALVVPHALSRAFGGVTGDVMGASVLVTETVVLASAALMGGLA